MPYCDSSDVLLYVPQAPAAADLSGYISEAEGIINANLREFFVTPLTTVEQYVKTIAAKLAGGSYLAAQVSRKRASVSERAEVLIEEAMDMLEKIKADPGMIAAEKLPVGGLPGEDSGVLVSGQDREPIFDLGDPGGWGE